MPLTKFCPRCGEETEELHGDEKKLCSDCFPDKNDLLDIPDKVEITVCSICGRMRKSGEWIEEYSLQDQLAATFEQFSEPDVKMELQYWEDDDQLFVRVHTYKEDIEDSYDVRVNFKDEQCKTCSRFNGGFYKVKLQLRGNSNLEKISNKMVDEAVEATNENRKDFVSNITKTDHGMDFFFSTERIAKKVLTMLRAQHDPEVKRSYELIGEEQGQRVYRNVISVRLDE